MSAAGRESPPWPSSRPWPAGPRTSTRSTSASGCFCGRGNDASPCRGSISSGGTRKTSRRTSTNRSTRSSTRLRSSSFRGSPNRFGRRASFFSRKGSCRSATTPACSMKRETTRSVRRFPEQRYQYGAVPIGELVSCLESLPATRTTRVDFRFEVSRDFLFDFLSIPAQSAGLFPKIPYLERIPKVRDFCDLLAKRVDPVFMGWEFLIARKR